MTDERVRDNAEWSDRKFADRTPAASSDERDGAREVRTILIRAGMHEDANSATQLIPYSIAARAVSEALAAIRPTDAHETPPVSQSGIQCFTCGETVQETSAGHCFSCIKSHRVPAASRPTDAGAGVLREALERIQDEPLHTLPIVTTQRMRNIASYALRGERLA